MDPSTISTAIMVVVLIGGWLTRYLTASERRRRSRLKHVEGQNVDLFGYVYELRRVIVSRLGRGALPPAPESLRLDSDDDE